MTRVKIQFHPDNEKMLINQMKKVSTYRNQVKTQNNLDWIMNDQAGALTIRNKHKIRPRASDKYRRRLQQCAVKEHGRSWTPVALSKLTCSSCQCSWRPNATAAPPQKQRTRLPPRPPNTSTAARGCLHSWNRTASAGRAGRSGGGRQRGRVLCRGTADP